MEHETRFILPLWLKLEQERKKKQDNKTKEICENNSVG